MRIAYVCYWNLGGGDAVARKIQVQLRLWQEAGHEAQAFAITPGGRLRETRPIVASVRRWRPDVLYLRYDSYLPAVWRLLRDHCTVVEVNSDDRKESDRRGFVAGSYNRWNRGRVFAAADGVVCVTNELAQPFPGPVAVVANGADPSAVPTLPAPANDRPRAVFSGSADMAWHGVDRLVELARAMPEVDFDVVGPAVDRSPANVVAHGRLADEAYWSVLGRADVAVGSLAMERAGLREGCPLKVREYLLAGLPTLIGYEDTDFPGAQPWYLARLEGAEQARAFIEQARGRRVPREEVESRLSWQVKETARLAFLAQVRGAS